MATKKAKQPARYVRIDIGYGPAEHWVTAKVCDQRTVSLLFGGESLDLLVETPGGERIWVSSWDELPAIAEGTHA